MRLSVFSGTILLSAFPAAAFATTFNVLWWDGTPEYGGQAPDELREEMSDYLDDFDTGDVFDATFVASETPGALATHLATNSYDVIIIDSTPQSLTFNDDDVAAVQDFYAGGNSNLAFDGNLYIRNINYDATTDFPGLNGSTGGFTVNSVFALGEAGGGIMFGTDHDCCQASVNFLINGILPGAEFTGITTPSTDGVFYGDLLLNGPQPIAAADILAHWDSVPSQAIAPTGVYQDFLGQTIELTSLVDVADFIGGPRNSMFSTSLAAGGGTTAVDDVTVGGNADPDDGGTGGGTDGSVAPVPGPLPAGLLVSGLLGLALLRRRAA